MLQRPRVHLARCEYCGKKIAWSRKRRQWLALAPATSRLPSTQLSRRMACLESPNRSFHDPRATVFGRSLTHLLRGRS